jgi:pimeloyl-ACP methyl ester carboxylesterase
VRAGHTYNSIGRGLLVSPLRSPDYSLADTVRAMRGITAAQAALAPELAALDLTHTLTRLNYPIVMVQGRHDQVSPASPAERYAELLQAPVKQLVWFDHSAHMPHLEEPERFRELLAQVRSACLPVHDRQNAAPGGPAR